MDLTNNLRFKTTPRLLQLAAAACLLAAPPSGSAATWLVRDQVGAPDWLRFSGEYRLRYETLDGQFRAGGAGGDQALASRLSLKAEADYRAATFGGELMDSRQFLNDTGSPLSTGHVNAMEPMQAYLKLNLGAALNDDRKASLTLGRQTFDLGSRRLFARNRYRNTINAFNGVRAQWEFGGGQELQAMWFLPQHRRPTARGSLLDHHIHLDREALDYQFWGLFLESPGLPLDSIGEFYVFGLHERDAATRASRNRRIITPGFRIHRKPTPGAWDWQWENAVQLGESRSSSAAANTTDLTHRAHFHHLTFGYTFDRDWQPRLALHYDYASGDRDPADGRNNRFDPLFGGNRFDYGPTGIHGAFARRNLNSPGLRISARPHARVELMAAHRLHWLAAAADSWNNSGLVDPTGAAGSYVGQQTEVRVRWDAIPKNLRIEAGAARLHAGRFIKNAPAATGQRDVNYGYLQATLKF